MASAEQQIQFLGNLQRLLSEGLFVATYKYALLLALADLCVEAGRDDDSELELSTFQIAGKVAEYYWRQAAPYLPDEEEADSMLRQNTGQQPRILKILREARARHAGSIAAFRNHSQEWSTAMRQIASQLQLMPLWKLQTIGNQQLDFLYANRGTGRFITLKAGIAFCFRAHHALVSDLVKGAWARYVRRYNAERLAEKTDLHDFLFGSNRTSRAVLRPILMEFQKGYCFYCRKPLHREDNHVDHFIPWSRYPVDLGHNFVLAHDTCNAAKSDHLAATQHLDAWCESNHMFGQQKASEFDRHRVVHDLTVSVRIIEWAYLQASQIGGLTWVKGKEMLTLPHSWRSQLGKLKALPEVANR